MSNKFRPLKADEIECRVAQIGARANGTAWCSILIYKDARVDQKLLDEVVGPANWKNNFDYINGNLYCTVSIWDPDKKEWISKQNVGTESNTEKEKGQASDAFKRACFNWGIGRELYSAPKIFIDLKTGEFSNENGKVRCKASFFVKEISYQEQKIDRLVIVDKSGNVRFSFSDGKNSSPISAPAQNPAPVKQECTKEIYWKLIKMDVEGVKSKFGKTGLEFYKAKYHPSEDDIKKFESDLQMARDARETQDFLDLDESAQNPKNK